MPTEPGSAKVLPGFLWDELKFTSMKSKASKSQVRRAAETLLNQKGFLLVNQFDHADWPAIRKSMQQAHKLEHSTEGGVQCLRKPR